MENSLENESSTRVLYSFPTLNEIFQHFDVIWAPLENYERINF